MEACLTNADLITEDAATFARGYGGPPSLQRRREDAEEFASVFSESSVVELTDTGPPLT